MSPSISFKHSDLKAGTWASSNSSIQFQLNFNDFPNDIKTGKFHGIEWLMNVIDFMNQEQKVVSDIFTYRRCRVEMGMTLSNQLTAEHKFAMLNYLSKLNDTQKHVRHFPDRCYMSVLNSTIAIPANPKSNKFHFIFNDCDSSQIRDVTFYSYLTVRTARPARLISTIELVDGISTVDNTVTLDIFFPLSKSFERDFLGKLTGVSCSDVIDDLSEKYNVHRMIETLSL